MDYARSIRSGMSYYVDKFRRRSTLEAGQLYCFEYTPTLTPFSIDIWYVYPLNLSILQRSLLGNIVRAAGACGDLHDNDSHGGVCGASHPVLPARYNLH